MFNSIRGRSKPTNFICLPNGKARVLSDNGSTVEIVEESRFIDPRLEYRAMSPLSRLENGEITLSSRAPRISVAPSIDDVRRAEQTLRDFVQYHEDNVVEETVVTPGETKVDNSSSSTTVNVTDK